MTQHRVPGDSDWVPGNVQVMEPYPVRHVVVFTTPTPKWVWKPVE